MSATTTVTKAGALLAAVRAADRRGSSRLVTQARRLRDALAREAVAA